MNYNLAEFLDELRGVADNFTCVRWGIERGLHVGADPKLIDNALYMINQRLDDIVDRLDKELYEREEDKRNELQAGNIDIAGKSKQ